MVLAAFRNWRKTRVLIHFWIQFSLRNGNISYPILYIVLFWFCFFAFCYSLEILVGLICLRNYLFQVEGFSYEFLLTRDKFIAFYHQGILATECKGNKMNKSGAIVGSIDIQKILQNFLSKVVIFFSVPPRSIVLSILFIYFLTFIA